MYAEGGAEWGRSARRWGETRRRGELFVAQWAPPGPCENGCLGRGSTEGAGVRCDLGLVGRLRPRSVHRAPEAHGGNSITVSSHGLGGAQIVTRSRDKILRKAAAQLDQGYEDSRFRRVKQSREHCECTTLALRSPSSRNKLWQNPRNEYLVEAGVVNAVDAVGVPREVIEFASLAALVIVLQTSLLLSTPRTKTSDLQSRDAALQEQIFAS